MRLCSLFAGIGGFDLAAQWMGWATAILVEWEAFPRAVLIKNFHCVPAEDLSAAQLATIIDAWKAWRPGQPHPTTVLYGDIRHFDARPWRGAIDLVCGGFPCQPYSDAGKKLGNDDPRALFPQMLRIIRELAPRLVVGENVRGLLSQANGLAFESVCTGLEAEGYEVQPLLLPACGVGAPHKRDRFWFVAHARCESGYGREAPHERNEPDRQDARRSESTSEHQRLCQEGAAACGSWTASNSHGCRCDPRKSGVLCERQGGSAAPEGDSQRPALCPAADGCGALPAYAHGIGQPQPQGPQPELGRRIEYSREETAPDTGRQCGPAVGNLCGRQPDACGRCETFADATSSMPQVGQVQRSHAGQEQQAAAGTAWRLTEPPLCGPDDGLPAGLVRTESGAAGAGQSAGKGKRKDTGRADALKGYGNAIVPQVAYELFQALEATTP